MTFIEKRSNFPENILKQKKSKFNIDDRLSAFLLQRMPAKLPPSNEKK